MSNLRQDFIAFSVAAGVLRFGEFKTKAGRTSPYFFNAGLFNDGAIAGAAGRILRANAPRLRQLPFDMLFGPAYKGIPLVAAIAIALAGHGRNVPFAFNRKEAKDHGEGGSIVGAPLAGRVLIVDDVISAGTSVRESVELIRAAGATPCGVLIALDRMERSGPRRTVGIQRCRKCSAIWPAGDRHRRPRRFAGVYSPPGRMRNWCGTRMRWRLIANAMGSMARRREASQANGCLPVTDRLD